METDKIILDRNFPPDERKYIHHKNLKMDMGIDFEERTTCYLKIDYAEVKINLFEKNEEGYVVCICTYFYSETDFEEDWNLIKNFYMKPKEGEKIIIAQFDDKHEAEQELENIAEWMKEHPGPYFVIGTNMGWRHEAGTQLMNVKTASDFFEKITPNTGELTMYMWEEDGVTKASVYHHDAHIGEGREIIPVKKLTRTRINKYCDGKGWGRLPFTGFLAQLVNEKLTNDLYIIMK